MIILDVINGKTGETNIDTGIFTERQWTECELERYKKNLGSHVAKFNETIIDNQKQIEIQRPFLRQYYLFLEALSEKYEKVEESKIYIQHREASCIYKNKKYGIIYPRKWLKLIKNQKKEIDFFFSGFKNPKNPNIRDWVFQYVSGSSQISYSDRGRKIPRNFFDENFFNLMSKSKFALCPQGYPYKWTYRFFEAILCKAIPILKKDDIDNSYKGFKYFIHDEKLDIKKLSKKYFLEIVNFNYQLALKELFI